MKEDVFSRLHYHSGLVAQGCWSDLDDYDREAIERFGDLIVKEHIKLLRQEWYELNDAEVTGEESARDIGFRVGQKAGINAMIAKINEHFGIDE